MFFDFKDFSLLGNYFIGQKSSWIYIHKLLLYSFYDAPSRPFQFQITCIYILLDIYIIQIYQIKKRIFHDDYCEPCVNVFFHYIN